MSVLVERDAAMVDRLRSVLGADTTVLAAVGELEGHLVRHPDEDVVVLGPAVDDDAAQAFARQHRVVRPSLGVVLVRPSVDSDALAQALRSGMSEVVATDDVDALRDAVRRAHDLARDMALALAHATAPVTTVTGAPRPTGSLLTVFSTKGGVGKSLVATNLAVALADQGQRVCIVDLDVQGGDVAIMLQLTPAHTLGDLSRIHGGIDASGVESLLTPHSDGLSVLAAPTMLGAPVPAESIGAVLGVLKGLFDVVVVDTSGAFDDYSLHALDHSELLVLVGTLDIPALKSLKLATGTLDLLNLPRERWRLVLNRADSKVGLSAQEFEETLGLESAVTLPSSRDVLTCVNRGEAIVRAHRGHQVSKTLAAFAAALLQDAAPTAVPAPDASGGGHRTRRSALRRTRKVA